MSFSKQYGPVTISESAGKISISASISESVGGGAVKGFATASAQATVIIEASDLADVGLEVLATKFPSLASEIALVKAALDAEIATA